MWPQCISACTACHNTRKTHKSVRDIWQDYRTPLFMKVTWDPAPCSFGPLEHSMSYFWRKGFFDFKEHLYPCERARHWLIPLAQGTRREEKEVRWDFNSRTEEWCDWNQGGLWRTDMFTSVYPQHVWWKVWCLESCGSYIYVSTIDISIACRVSTIISNKSLGYSTWKTSRDKISNKDSIYVG